MTVTGGTCTNCGTRGREISYEVFVTNQKQVDRATVSPLIVIFFISLNAPEHTAAMFSWSFLFFRISSRERF